MQADARRYLEGWDAEYEQVMPEVDGPGIEPVVRVRVRGTKDLAVVHEFAAGMPQADDITILALRYLGEPRA